MRIAVGNRFFETRPEKAVEAQQKIRQFVESCLTVEAIATVLVAVNIERDVSNAIDVLADIERCKVIPVTPWGKFVPALNALISEAVGTGHTHILFASTEIVLTPEIVVALERHMNEETLVVGARVEGHEFGLGARECNGVTTPWNTLALWDLAKLCRLGVPMTGDALFDPTGKNAGVEEVATIALYQHCFADCQTKLVQVSGVAWETEKLEGARLEAHQGKMASKVKRPAAQLQFARLQPGRVLHIAA